MTTIDIKGPVLDDVTGMMYDWMDVANVCPSKVSGAINDGNDGDIIVNVASNGGDVLAASEIYTMLKDSDRNVVVNIQGLAASAASVISMAGDQVNMSPTAMLMIHQASTQVDGNQDDMNQSAQVLGTIDQSIAAAYEAKTGMSQGQILNMMSNETWMTAQDACKKGFADSIMFADESEPVLTNSFEQIPSKKAVNKFLNLLNEVKGNKEEAQASTDETKDSSEKTEKSEVKEEKSEEELRSELRNKKAAILLGKK